MGADNCVYIFATGVADLDAHPVAYLRKRVMAGEAGVHESQECTGDVDIGFLAEGWVEPDHFSGSVLPASWAVGGCILIPEGELVTGGVATPT